MVAFDLLFLDGEDLGSLPVADRRRQVQRLLRKSSKARLQFSQVIAGDGPAVFAEADRMGLRALSRSVSIAAIAAADPINGGRSSPGRRGRFVLVGTELDSRSGAPIALVARHDQGALRYAGGRSSRSRGQCGNACMPGSNGDRGTAGRSRH